MICRLHFIPAQRKCRGVNTRADRTGEGRGGVGEVKGRHEMRRGVGWSHAAAECATSNWVGIADWNAQTLPTCPSWMKPWRRAERECRAAIGQEKSEKKKRCGPAHTRVLSTGHQKEKKRKKKKKKEENNKSYLHNSYHMCVCVCVVTYISIGISGSGFVEVETAGSIDARKWRL